MRVREKKCLMFASRHILEGAQEDSQNSDERVQDRVILALVFLQLLGSRGTITFISYEPVYTSKACDACLSILLLIPRPFRS